jgi:hypothetical protein
VAQQTLVPTEFKYPEDSIGAGKRFVFSNSRNRQYLYVDLKWVYHDKKNLKCLCRYNANFKLDSVLELNGQLYEIYYQLSVLNPKMIRGTRTYFSVSSNSIRVFEEKSSVIFKNDTMSMEMSSKSRYLKDTSILWNGNFIPCIIIKTTGLFKDKSKTNPKLRGIQRTTLYSYYAKGVGRIKYTISSTYNRKPEKPLIYELQSIGNIEVERVSN